MRRISLTVCIGLVCCSAITSAGTLNSDHEKRLQSYSTLLRYMRNGTEANLPEKCGLPAISYAIENRKNLPPDVAAALNNVLDRPATQKSIVSGMFRIHYDTTGDDAAAMLDSSYQRIPNSADQFADSVASIVNYCLTFETQVLGYPPPPRDNGEDGGTELDIYILDISPDGDYGFTTPEDPINGKSDGGTFTSFITIDHDFSFVEPNKNKGLPALRVTLAHELHHTIQIGDYGYWIEDRFFYELTSVWMEDVVFTDVNDYYNYLTSVQSQFNEPDVPFNSNSFIMYSRGIWGHYVAKRFGRDAMRKTWEQISSVPPLQAIDNALSAPEYSSSFQKAFAEWSTWNYFTGARSDSALYYPEGANYPEMTTLAITFMPPSQTEAGTLQAVASRYFDFLYQGKTFTTMLVNDNLQSLIAGGDTAFTYLYSINTNNSASGISINLSVSDPSNWFNKEFFNSPVIAAPFPDPFTPGSGSFLSIPVQGTAPVTGTLYIYSTSMKLVYKAALTSQFNSFLGEEGFEWNGISNTHASVGSGVYIYILQIQNQVTKGKFVVLK
jgi:hypothetical protein